MKKNLLLGALVSTLLVSNTFAIAPSPAFTGFYIGAGPTYSSGKIKGDSDDSDSITSKGVGINVFAGYGSVIQGGLYLSGEVSLGYDGSRFKKTIGKTTFKSNSFIYNVAARVGYAFGEFLPYVKVGYEGRSKISVVRKTVNVASLSRDGFLLGLGADYAVTKNVFIRGEYHYNFGSRKKVDSVNIKTPTNAFLIGAGYRF